MFLTLARFFTYVSFFSVVIVLTGTFFPFIGGKYYFFRTMVSAAVVCLLFWWAFEASAGTFETHVARLFRDPLVIAVSLFVFSYVLASVLAYDPHSAFWSNYERGEGGFQMIHYYLFFLLLCLLFQRREEWRFVFAMMLVAGVSMVLYGVLGTADFACMQANRLAGEQNAAAGCPQFGFITPYAGSSLEDSPRGLWAMLRAGRFQGSLGNPAYVAPYLIFSMFYAAWLWYESSKKAHQTVFYGLLILFFAVFFVFSQTRGSFLGLAVAFFVALLYLFIIQPRSRMKFFLLILGVIVVALGVGVRSYCHALKNNSPEAPETALCRISNISVQEQTFQTRSWTWGSAIEGWKDRPLLGWGPENFSAVFDKHFDPRHFIPGRNTETWFDRAHSVLFDYLAETGIVGLLSYLSIFVVFCYLFIQRIMLRSDRHSHTKAEKQTLQPFAQALLVAVPVAYGVQGLALFDVLPIYLNLFLFLAFSRMLFSSLSSHYAERRA
jgi:O-antigen ligase